MWVISKSGEAPKGFKMLRIFEIVLTAIMGVLMGFVIAHHYHQEDVKDFKREAVLYKCGFWNVNGDFDWKSPELTMEKL